MLVGDGDERVRSRDDAPGRCVDSPVVAEAGEDPQASEERDNVHVLGFPGFPGNGCGGVDVVVWLEGAEHAECIADCDVGVGVFDDEPDRFAFDWVVFDGEWVSVDDSAAD